MLAPIVARVEAGRLRGADRIGLAVGKVIDRYKVAKHFRLDIGEDHLVVTRDEAAIMEEAALDGVYVLRTSVAAERLDDVGVVRAYKRLSRVERAFRGFKAPDLAVRPIHHHTSERVRAHIFLCTLAYYVQWHLERAWAPLLFHDETIGRSCPTRWPPRCARGGAHEGPHAAAARWHTGPQLPDTAVGVGDPDPQPGLRPHRRPR